MTTNEYKYAIEVLREDNTPVGQASLKVDWGPAEEWARFQAQRRGQLALDVAGRASSILPIWLPDPGEPFIQGFRVSIDTGASGEAATDFSTVYFKRLATAAASLFVEKGNLQQGDKFRYLVSAFRDEAHEPTGSRFQFTVEEVSPAIVVKETALGDWMSRSDTHGPIADDDVPAFVPQRVLEEATSLAQAAGMKETGGILIGHLHRDGGAREMFIEVTSQIPARHTEADLTKLTFTAETWTEVQAAIDLRRRGEVMLGWWHSHPVREWCKDCPSERQRVCAMAGDFFSAHDQALHRTVFPRAYSVALVANDLATGEITFSGFGWRNGLLESRGFYVVDSQPALQPGLAAQSIRQQQQPACRIATEDSPG